MQSDKGFEFLAGTIFARRSRESGLKPETLESGLILTRFQKQQETSRMTKRRKTDSDDPSRDERNHGVDALQHDTAPVARFDGVESFRKPWG